MKVSVAALTAPESHVSDVSLFVEELNLDQEAEEMGAVANTFRGVESLDGASNWEGLYFQPAKSQLQKNWKRVKPVEVGFSKTQTLFVNFEVMLRRVCIISLCVFNSPQRSRLFKT